MSFDSDNLTRVLDLEPDGIDRFLGRSPAVGWPRIFGGLVIAQALIAMDRTAGARPAHSMHGYFMLPGDPAEPVAYVVERLRDGGSFTTRRCVASQSGVPIFTMSASFHVAEPRAFDHGSAMPEVPPPESLPSREEMRAGGVSGLNAAVRAYFERETPIELRPVDFSRFSDRTSGRSPAIQSVWMRASGLLPNDAAVHAAVLAYMSDMTLLDTALMAHGRSVFDRDIQAASLDHALWLHRPARADEWLLYSADSPSASGALGFARGSIFDRSGALIASVAQEGLIRQRRALR